MVFNSRLTQQVNWNNNKEDTASTCFYWPAGHQQCQILLKVSSKTRSISLSISNCFALLNMTQRHLGLWVTLSSGWILSTGKAKGFLLFLFSMAAWASAIAHLSIGWGKLFCTRSWGEERREGVREIENPLIVQYFWPEPYGPFLNVVEYIGSHLGCRGPYLSVIYFNDIFPGTLLTLHP